MLREMEAFQSESMKLTSVQGQLGLGLAFATHPSWATCRDTWPGSSAPDLALGT